MGHFLLVHMTFSSTSQSCLLYVYARSYSSDLRKRGEYKCYLHDNNISTRHHLVAYFSWCTLSRRLARCYFFFQFSLFSFKLWEISRGSHLRVSAHLCTPGQDLLRRRKKYHHLVRTECCCGCCCCWSVAHPIGSFQKRLSPHHLERHSIGSK